MVDQFVAEAGVEQPFRERHADGVGQPLPQRAGGGLDAGGVAVLGMAGGARAELAEIPDFVDGHVGVAGEIQERVEQHRTMAGRQHEAVAVVPVRRRRVELEEARKQHGGHVGHAHRHPGVAGIRLLDRVGSKEADGVSHLGVADGTLGGSFHCPGGLGSGHRWVSCVRTRRQCAHRP